MSKAKYGLDRSKFPPHVESGAKKVKEDIFISDKVYNWSWNNIRQVNLNRLHDKDIKKDIKKLNPKIILFPNFSGKLFVKIEEKETKDDVLIYSKSMKSEYFLGDEMRKGIPLSDVCKLSCYVYRGVIDGNYCYIYSLSKLNPQKIYNINALRYEVVSGSTGHNIISNMYIVFTATEEKLDYSKIKDLKFNSIQDITLVWDYKNDGYIWDDIETAIILCNTFYMEQDVPALNLILCGKTEAKKTPWIILLSRIFGDVEVSSANLTDKGLVPSFYGKSPKLGALIESNYITLLDDFFRFFDQQSMKYKIGSYIALRIGLSQIMNILDRAERKFDSGKFSVITRYSSSFFATDNMKYINEMKKLWEDDKAIVRRFSFLLASKETTIRGYNAYVDTDIAIKKLQDRLLKFRLTFDKYNLLGSYIREKMQRTIVDENVIDKIDKEIQTRYKQNFHMTTKIRAIYKFCKCIKEFIPSFGDNMFEKMVWRLANDFNEICVEVNSSDNI